MQGGRGIPCIGSSICKDPEVEKGLPYLQTWKKKSADIAWAQRWELDSTQTKEALIGHIKKFRTYSKGLVGCVKKYMDLEFPSWLKG